MGGTTRAGAAESGAPAKNRQFDTIVIGSGIGGLTTASLLAQIADRRVLVLEKHFEIGGFTHAFRRKGYSFDVGLHYVGQMHPGSLSRRVMDAVTGGAIAWNPMPSVYDRFIYPFGTFEAPSDPETYERQLQDRFAHEAAAISRYFKDIKRAAAWIQRDATARFLPRPVAALLRTMGRPSRRLALQRTQVYMDRHFRDEQLKRVLLSQWGDYGITPAKSSFAVHALIVEHYLYGAFYPAGGPERIARAVEEIVEAKGGRILFQSEATQILTDGSTAYGVRVRHQPSGELIDYHASTIFSDAGAQQTFQTLLPAALTTRAERQLARVRAVTQATDTGNSAVILFLGLNDDPKRLGIQGENYWIFGDLAHSELHAHTQALMHGKPQSAYLSFPSMKAGDNRPPSAEIVSMVDPAEFASWMDTTWGHRGAQYDAMKQRVAEGLLALAESVVPGIRALVSYSELATPATIRSFTSRRAGHMYGLAATPERYANRTVRAQTPIKNLYLTGSDLVSPGIAGATFGGVGAAAAVLGARKVFPYLDHSPKPQHGRQPQAPAHRPEPIANDRVPARLTARYEVAHDVIELRFRLPWTVRIWPGQYARIEISRLEWRDYSIADYQLTAEGGMELLFVIDTSFGGHGSAFARDIAVGETRFMRVPAGGFTFHPSARSPIFIATGTGITPLIAMIRHGASGPSEPTSATDAPSEPASATDAPSEPTSATGPRLLFGCRTRAQDLSARYLQGAIRTDVCLSREALEAGEPPQAGCPQVEAGADGTPHAGASIQTPSSDRRYRSGRVTDALRADLTGRDREPQSIVPQQSDFYVCGNPGMVQEVEELLRSFGADRVYSERY